MKRAKSLAVFQLSVLSFSRIVLTASLAKAVTAAMAIWQRMVVQFMMNLLSKVNGLKESISERQWQKRRPEIRLQSKERAAFGKCGVHDGSLGHVVE